MRPAPLPASLRSAGFTAADAHEVGIGEQRLRRGDIDRPFRGVYRAAGSSTTTDLAAAYAARMPPHHAFSHWTAAALHGMRIPSGKSEHELHVTALAGVAPRVRGVVGHAANGPVRTVDVHGLRVTSPVQTWLDLASLCDERGLVILGDGLVRRRRPDATLEQLARAVASTAGRRGARNLRRALARIRPGSDSPRETELRLLLIASGLPEPEMNGVVHANGRRYHGDLVFRRQRVIVEYDGWHHLKDERQWSIDTARLNDLHAAGWVVVRIDAALWRNPAAVVAAVATALTRNVAAR